jgi:hypothetical protein
LGPPAATVAVARTVLVPALREALNDFLFHVSHEPVPGNDRPDDTTVPLTVMFIGRSMVPPLAYAIVNVAVPLGALTVHSTYPPVTFA